MGGTREGGEQGCRDTHAHTVLGCWETLLVSTLAREARMPSEQEGCQEQPSKGAAQRGQGGASVTGHLWGTRGVVRPLPGAQRLPALPPRLSPWPGSVGIWL